MGTMKRTLDLEVGDEVVVVSAYRSLTRSALASIGRARTVAKVNRVWLIDSNGDRWHRETGHDNGDPSALRIVTPELGEDEVWGGELRAALRTAGISAIGQFASDKLEKILGAATDTEVCHFPDKCRRTEHIKLSSPFDPLVLGHPL